VIAAVDGKSTQGLSLEEVVRVVRGKPGTSVRLTVRRDAAAPFEITLNRSIVKVQTVKSVLLPDRIGYVRITQFDDATPTELAEALSRLKQEAADHLAGFVLDLRNDPGGLLNSAVDVASDFLDNGSIVSIRGRLAGETKKYEGRGNGDRLRGVPMIILINGASASASEIVAGALQDRHRATVMGTRSFGKGSVQSIIPLKDHGALRLTTAMYFTPAGRSIQAEGIWPDIVVEVSKDQQIEGAVLLREGALARALSNDTRSSTVGQAGKPATYSAPIKPELIGTATDMQLQAAISHLQTVPNARK